VGEQGSHVTVPIMIFDGHEGLHFASAHNDPLVVELKLDNALVHRILIVTESSINIITWHCLKRLKYPRRKMGPLIHPILRFEGQEVNPTRMIRLSMRFGGKSKARNLEVDFLVVDVPTTCTLILGWPTLNRVKAIIASYFLQLQHEADDGSVGKLQGDQCTARECHLVSIRPLVEHSSERGPAKPPPSNRKSRITLPPPTKTTVICTLTSADPGQLHLKPVDSLEGIPLDEG